MTVHEKVKAVLAAMRAREQAATNGLWNVIGEEDAMQFIAHVRTDFPLLLAVVEAYVAYESAEVRYYLAAAAHDRTGSEEDKAAKEVAEHDGATAVRAYTAAYAALAALGEP